MKTIYFMRHGETEENVLKRIQGQRDFPLNERGIFQAKEAGNYLSKNRLSFDAVFSSPLSRAYQTAILSMLISNPNTKVEVKDCFKERCFGEAEGLNITDQVFLDMENGKFKNVESEEELKKRVYEGVLECLKDYNNILIVAHSHTIKGFLKAIDPSFSFQQKLVNCSLVKVVYDQKIFKIEEVNIRTDQ